MARIELDQVAKRFEDGAEALKPTSLVIEDGERFVLVGPSGCGKSTLLRIIVGLERPSTGAVYVDGVDVTDRDPRERNMAMVFQNYALYPHMSVRENLAFPLKLARLPRAEIDDRVARAAAILDLTARLDHKPAALSGGQRQRVAMGRAIVREPVAFLLDEPLSNLDAALRAQMRAELVQLQRRLGTTLLYVTHDQTEALTLGDRLAVLRRGEVQQIGTPRELYRHPANLFVAGFIGAPPMNLMPARLAGDRLSLPLTELSLPPGSRPDLGPGAHELIAGIRPEHFSLVDSEADQRGNGEEATFEIQVEVAEWLGAELYLHFEVPAQSSDYLARLGRELSVTSAQDDRIRLIARVDADAAVTAGTGLRLRLDPMHIQLFDARTGDSLISSSL